MFHLRHHTWSPYCACNMTICLSRHCLVRYKRTIASFTSSDLGFLLCMQQQYTGQFGCSCLITLAIAAWTCLVSLTSSSWSYMCSLKIKASVMNLMQYPHAYKHDTRSSLPRLLIDVTDWLAYLTNVRWKWTPGLIYVVSKHLFHLYIYIYIYKGRENISLCRAILTKLAVSEFTRLIVWSD